MSELFDIWHRAELPRFLEVCLRGPWAATISRVCFRNIVFLADVPFLIDGDRRALLLAVLDVVFLPLPRLPRETDSFLWELGLAKVERVPCVREQDFGPRRSALGSSASRLNLCFGRPPRTGRQQD